MRKSISIILSLVMILSMTNIVSAAVLPLCPYCDESVDIMNPGDSCDTYENLYHVDSLDGVMNYESKVYTENENLFVVIDKGSAVICIPCLEEKINDYKSEYQRETTVSYIGDCDEYFEVNVPSTITPGDSKTVTVEGTWASDREFRLTASDSVLLTNNISGGDEKLLDVNFAGIVLVGDNTTSVSKSETISIEEISDALFGTWEGTISYDISVVDI